MAAYHRVYDSRHLQADCQAPGSAPEPIRSALKYGQPLPFSFLLHYLSLDSTMAFAFFMSKVFEVITLFSQQSAHANNASSKQ